MVKKKIKLNTESVRKATCSYSLAEAYDLYVLDLNTRNLRKATLSFYDRIME